MKDTKNKNKTFIFMGSLNRIVGSEKQDCEFEEGDNESNWSGGTPQLVRVLYTALSRTSHHSIFYVINERGQRRSHEFIH